MLKRLVEQGDGRLELVGEEDSGSVSSVLLPALTSLEPGSWATTSWLCQDRP